MYVRTRIRVYMSTRIPARAQRAQSDVTHMNEVRHAYMGIRHVTHVNELCHTELM